MDPTESVVRNLFLIQRLANTAALGVEVLIRDLFDEIVGNLAKLDPTAVKALGAQQARIAKLIKLVDTDAKAAFKQVLGESRQLLAEIGRNQSAWASSLLVDSLEAGGIAATLKPGLVGANQWKAIIDSNFIEGRLLADWFADQGAAVGKKVEAEIRKGLLGGESVGDMVRRVRGRSTGAYDTVTLKSGAKRRLYRFEDGVLQATTRNATAVVRTATNQVSNEAHMSVFEANADVMDGVEFNATLDSNTTLLCASLDGTVWEMGSPDIRQPPLHWQCRSTLVPVIKGLEGVGTKAAEGGPVKASTTYEQWLRAQTKEKQDAILGPSRAELFRGNKATLRDMVRKDGSTVRLDELDS